MRQDLLHTTTTNENSTSASSIETLQRNQIRALQARVAILQNTANKWENDATQLRAELTFVQHQNDKLVEKLETARRALDECERLFGFKIPTPPEAQPDQQP